MKTNQIACIVNSQSIRAYNHEPFAISKVFMDCMKRDLFVDIDEWIGVNVFRMKNEIATFRQYFIRSRKWWDQKKTKGYAEIFWLRIFEHIQEVSYIYSNL